MDMIFLHIQFVYWGQCYVENGSCKVFKDFFSLGNESRRIWCLLVFDCRHHRHGEKGEREEEEEQRETIFPTWLAPISPTRRKRKEHYSIVGWSWKVQGCQTKGKISPSLFFPLSLLRRILPRAFLAATDGRCVSRKEGRGKDGISIERCQKRSRFN